MKMVGVQLLTAYAQTLLFSSRPKPRPRSRSGHPLPPPSMSNPSSSSSLSSLSSLPSSLPPDIDSDEEEYLRAQKEWDEQVEQLQMLVELFVLPFVGKWMGRRWSFWGESGGVGM